jgi:hypothetical protein
LIYNNHTYYNCEITLDTGDKYQVDANWIHNQQLDNWQGWECNAGVDRIYIDSNLEIFVGECMNARLGGMSTGWATLSAPGICQKTRCTGCTDDLLITKKESK